MKYFLFFLLTIIAGTSFAQEGFLPLDDNKNVLYSDRVSVNLTKEDIYKKVQNWVIHSFGNYENAVIGEDAQTGKLVVSSYSPVATALYDHVRFNMIISVQNNLLIVRIDQLDGVSSIRTPARLGVKDNESIRAREISIKAETNKKKREELEEMQQAAKMDNDNINSAMYQLLASLKEFVKK